MFPADTNIFLSGEINDLFVLQPSSIYEVQCCDLFTLNDKLLEVTQPDLMETVMNTTIKLS